MKNVKKIIGSIFVTSMLVGSVAFVDTTETKAELTTKSFTIDGNKVDQFNRFKGFGTVTANNTSRLISCWITRRSIRKNTGK
ncbi:hypothetical protein M3175_09850 [Robertmurraya korlensis]|uniref:hypothetical protein n=1 Tax=Robertmurraya korlensis TaxID=519977 RepID=UPI00203A50E6|nr:hypothetical protein [Robertmurraya korlensis]MCM3601034.1 hypothetical protein [Robertmurraya korlensis]